MRFFETIDFQHLVLAICLGLAAALVIYAAFRNGRTEGRREEAPMSEGRSVPEVPRTGQNRVPPVLIFLYAGFVVWFIIYVIYFGLHREAF